MSDRLPIADLYVHGQPTPQAVLDLFRGEWSSRLPVAADGSALSAGPVGLFDDGRVAWALGLAGLKPGWRVCELGPLEGGHTYLLCRAGAQVTAVEMHSRAFLRCLCAREVLGYTGATFLLGDGLAHLRAPGERYDWVFASGVLYHQTDPLGLLEAAAARAPRLFLWTHVYEAALVEPRPEVARQFTGPWTAEFRGVQCRGRRRVYMEEHNWLGTCGGPDAGSIWLERETLLNVLRALGYTRIEIGFDDPAHPHGPALAVYAER